MTDDRRFTQTQRAVLDALRALWTPLNGPPSIEEIRKYVGVGSRNTIWMELQRLAVMGAVTKTEDRRYVLTPEYQ